MHKVSDVVSVRETENSRLIVSVKRYSSFGQSELSPECKQKKIARYNEIPDK